MWLGLTARAMVYIYMVPSLVFIDSKKDLVKLGKVESFVKTVPVVENICISHQYVDSGSGRACGVGLSAK